MEFVGPEVHAAPNAANNALVIDEGWSGASPITPWVSHPAAIGYRRQGAISIGSGSHIKTIAAVAPEFDSGMNDGTDGQEQERVANFYTGAEENPTSAQSAPTPRAEEQTGGIGGPGGGPSMGGITDPSSGKEPTWTPAFNPYSGHGYYNPFAGWSLPSFWPFGGGDDGGTGDSNGSGFNLQSVDDSPGPPVSVGPSRSPGGPTNGSPGDQISPQNGPMPAPDAAENPAIDPPHLPGGNMPNTGPDGTVDEGTPTPGSPPAGVNGSEVDPSQPAPQQDTGGSAIIGADDDPEGGLSWGDEPPSMSAAPSENFIVGAWNNLTSTASEFFTRDAAREQETAMDRWDRLDAARRNTLLSKLYYHLAIPVAAGAGDALDGMAHLLGDTPGTLERLGGGCDVVWKSVGHASLHWNGKSNSFATILVPSGICSEPRGLLSLSARTAIAICAAAMPIPFRPFRPGTRLSLRLRAGAAMPRRSD